MLIIGMTLMVISLAEEPSYGISDQHALTLLQGKLYSSVCYFFLLL